MANEVHFKVSVSKSYIRREAWKLFKQHVRDGEFAVYAHLFGRKINVTWAVFPLAWVKCRRMKI